MIRFTRFAIRRPSDHTRNLAFGPDQNAHLLVAMNATKILWGQVLLVSSVVLAFVWGATEWVAWRLAFQIPARPPVVRDFSAGQLYQPPAFFWWWFAYDAYARDIFVEGAYIAASGGIAAVVVAIAMSVWRAREVKARHHLWLCALGRDARSSRGRPARP